MKPVDSQFNECLFYSASALARSLGRMAEEEFAAVGVAPSYAFLLMAVNEDHGANPSAISQKMQLSPSTITRLIEKMEYKGYLERKLNGKYTQVYPTSLGANLDLKLRKAWNNLHRRYFRLLGEKTAKTLTSGIYQAYHSLEENRVD